MSNVIKSHHLKYSKCIECDEPLRLCKKGLICKQNHLFDKESEVWLHLEAFVTGINQEVEVRVVEAGFMMRESSGRNKQSL